MDSHVKCWFCGFSDVEIYLDIPKIKTSERYYLYRCPKCAFIFMYPFVSINKVYDNDKWLEDIYFENISIPIVISYLDILESFAKKTRGRLLEVGCGCGHFLFAAQARGWDVTGVDISKLEIIWAKKYLRLNVCSQPVQSLIGDNIFDAIVLIETIEHVENPLDVIANCFRLMKPSGVLLLTTPNIGTKGLFYQGQDWNVISPGHLHYFSRNTISVLLNKVGLLPIFINSVGGGYGDESLIVVAMKPDINTPNEPPDILISQKVDKRYDSINLSCGELLPNKTLKLIFQAKNGLTGIGVCLATYNRQNRGQGIFRLYLDHNLPENQIFNIEFDLSEVGNNQFKIFEFSPINNLEGHHLILTIDFPLSSVDNAITAWCSNKAFENDEFYIGNSRENSGLVYTLHYL